MTKEIYVRVNKIKIDEWNKKQRQKNQWWQNNDNCSWEKNCDINTSQKSVNSEIKLNRIIKK